MHNTLLNGIKHIIFDLGVVLLDLDFKKAEREFKKLGFHSFSDFYSKAHALDFFHQFETGKVSNKEFLEELKKNLGENVNEDDIKNAWNTIIVGFPAKKTELIKSVSENYNLYMLSNTNSLHAEKYEQLFLQQCGKPLQHFFNNVYYSHTIGIRKPDKKAFTYILEEQQLAPEKTLFIDDIAENLKPAEELGMAIFHYTSDNDLYGLFKQ